MTYAPLTYDPARMNCRINLSSDTQTKPSLAMREVMARAEVGDEQQGTDPTVRLLCERMAEKFGKEAAVFMPSGTMCNQVALLTHCRPGDEILAHRTAHIVTSEAGGAWALGGIQVTGLAGDRGQFDVDTLAGAIRAKSRYAPEQRLVTVEQTSNSGGGSVWPLEKLNAVADAAHSFGMLTHMDGARMLNACVALGIDAEAMAAGYDTVWLDFSKGLGAPLGGVLLGTSDFIDRAWRWKQRLGGSMRQAGICAAACLFALDNNVERLAEDHANAGFFAQGLSKLPGIKVEPTDTNLAFFDVSGTGMTSSEIMTKLLGRGIWISAVAPNRMRACFHLDIPRAQVEEALQEIAAICDEAEATSAAEKHVHREDGAWLR